MLDGDKARHKMMAEKLYYEVQHGRIENDFVVNFVCDVRVKLNRGLTLTDKQATKLEELFEKH